MKTLRHPKILLLATILFANSAAALASTGASSLETSERLMLAGVDYCYGGSLVDPNTGEVVELYVPCPEDGFEQNMDFA
jgi:hypothetical protein